MSGLEIDRVHVAFGGVHVLAGVSLSIDDGETLALLGRSGSGKSTLLRVVAGLETPIAGSVCLGGSDMTGRPTHRRDVGLVFQDPSLFPHLDVGRNVAFGLRMAGVGRAETAERVRANLELVGLAGFERREPSGLSGGEAQRVALARALAPGPAALLLDEPLAALDRGLHDQLVVELRAVLRSRGVTTLAVTHDPTEAAALGHRIAALVDGRIVQVDAPDVFVSRPVSAAVASLAGHRNVFVGRRSGSQVDTPWGTAEVRTEVPGTGADGVVDVLVEPGQVRLCPPGGGPSPGTVSGVLFRGGTTTATVAAPDGGEIEVAVDSVPAVGSAVSVDVRTAHVMPAR